MAKKKGNAIYYPAAEEARELEQSGEYRKAAHTWAKANRLSRNPLNIEWSERRSEFCLTQIGREKFKESANYAFKT